MESCWRGKVARDHGDFKADDSGVCRAARQLLGDYEDAVRNAISIGGDSDTIACIAGGIAEVMFGLPDEIAEASRGYLTDDLVEVVDWFADFI